MAEKTEQTDREMIDEVTKRVEGLEQFVECCSKWIEWISSVLTISLVLAIVAYLTGFTYFMIPVGVLTFAILRILHSRSTKNEETE